jgi:hypothetical protein
MPSTCRSLAWICALASLVAFPAAAHAALAKAARGGTAPLASYSGTLSGNPTIRQQQLICDPPEPILGSTSVEYEPEKVTLTDFAYGPGYGPQRDGEAALVGFVGVVDNNESFLQEIRAFLSQPAGRETGYVQLFYQLDGAAGQIAPGGRVYDDDPGLGAPGEGVDTHQFLFTEITRSTPGAAGGGVAPAGVIVAGPATFHIYADSGLRGFREDVLIGRDDAGAQVFFKSGQIGDATVTAPEPSGLCLLGAAGLALLARRRARG